MTSSVRLKPDTTDVGRLKPDPTGRGQYSPAEKVNSELNRFEDKLAWVAYFNAGIRVVDLSDPYNLKEVGSYMPKTTRNRTRLRRDNPRRFRSTT